MSHAQNCKRKRMKNYLDENISNQNRNIELSILTPHVHIFFFILILTHIVNKSIVTVK